MPEGTQTRNFTLTVRYAETDAQGVVHHSNYLVWFEEGRSEFLRQQGCFYSDMERDGFFVIVAKVEVDYRAASFYEDQITIATTLEKFGKRLMIFSYQATNQEGVVVATGRTRHLVLGANRQLVSLPEKYLEILRKEDS